MAQTDGDCKDEEKQIQTFELNGLLKLLADRVNILQEDTLGFIGKYDY